MRPITLEQAKAKYVHRYTIEHVPQWARVAPDECKKGEPIRPGYYAPHYHTDAEWYANTIFPGENFLSKRDKYCHSSGQTWPLGMWLNKPYR